jgi:hypothetical protein
MVSERIYRDSVPNIIRLKTDKAEGNLLSRLDKVLKGCDFRLLTSLVHLIDIAEFQRLRRIRQLGLAHFTYQGAEDSRFTHSLGVLNLAI